MPWTAADAKRHTSKANTPEKSAAWAKVANGALARGADEGSAIRQANAVVAGTAKHTKRAKKAKARRDPDSLHNARRSYP